MRWQPAIRTLPQHHDPAYINALKMSVEKHLSNLEWEPDVILTSFHGLPVRIFGRVIMSLSCCKTSRLLGESLGLVVKKWLMFQSRFGPAAWRALYR